MTSQCFDRLRWLCNLLDRRCCWPGEELLLSFPSCPTGGALSSPPPLLMLLRLTLLRRLLLRWLLLVTNNACSCHPPCHHQRFLARARFAVVIPLHLHPSCHLIKHNAVSCRAPSAELASQLRRQLCSEDSQPRKSKHHPCSVGHARLII